MFGQNCQETCGSKLNCKGLRFCLPDPYGCSCASGWFGSHCENGMIHNLNKIMCFLFFLWHFLLMEFQKWPYRVSHYEVLFSSILLSACHNGMYGPDCKFSCKCQNGGVCSRFSGCQCPRGWRGQHCDRSGRYLNSYSDMHVFFFSLFQYYLHSSWNIVYRPAMQLNKTVAHTTHKP